MSFSIFIFLYYSTPPHLPLPSFENHPSFTHLFIFIHFTFNSTCFCLLGCENFIVISVRIFRVFEASYNFFFWLTIGKKRDEKKYFAHIEKFSMAFIFFVLCCPSFLYVHSHDSLSSKFISIQTLFFLFCSFLLSFQMSLECRRVVYWRFLISLSNLNLDSIHKRLVCSMLLIQCWRIYFKNLNKRDCILFVFFHSHLKLWKLNFPII